MKKPAVLLLDFCGARNKEIFLRPLAEGLSPCRLIVSDHKREWWRYFLLGPLHGKASFLRQPVPEGLTLRACRSSTLMKSELPPDLMQALANQLSGLVWEKGVRLPAAGAMTNLLVAGGHVERLLEEFSPSLVIVWNAFHPLSRLAVEIIRRHHLPVAFLEYGLLPDTLSFDVKGQMGESSVALEYEEFRKLSFSPSCMRQLQEVLANIIRRGRDRHYQPGVKSEKFMKYLRSKARQRPIVCYIGHNSWSSGTVAWNAPRHHLHSTVEICPRKTARYLARLAKEHGWFLLYKPHPFSMRKDYLASDDDMAVLGRTNIHDVIRASDVVLTTISQASYIALVERKPLVMLGYNQLRGKKCHYQVCNMNNTARMINTALEEGMTEDKVRRSYEHFCRLYKYYLFCSDDNLCSNLSNDMKNLANIIKKYIFEELPFDDYWKIYSSMKS